MVETILERAIYDLDIRRFISYFLSPHNPEDSLDYMATELVTLKRGEELQAYREAVQELMNNPSLRQTIEGFVKEDYDLKSSLKKRDRVVGRYGISGVLAYIDRSKLKELVKADFQALRNYRNTVERAREIDCESSLFRGLKEFSSDVTEDENYQTSRNMVDMMENFGEARLDVRYDYFDTVEGVEHLKYNPNERKIREMLGWYLHKVNVGINYFLDWGYLSLFPSRREQFYVKALEFLIEQNLPLIQGILRYRKMMDFLLGATRYREKIESSGIPLTFPSFDNEDGLLIIELYNPCLLFQEGIKGKEGIVANDVESNPEQNVAIITGPSNTGKTVYVKSIGLAYVLAQNGFPIPAIKASLSELDGIYTHFIHPEDIALGEGTFLDELRRGKELFQNATSKSLVLVGEPVRGNSPEDVIKINFRLIKGFVRLNAPTFLTTHLHSVSQEVDGWEGVRNLQTEVKLDGNKIIPTYRIKPGTAGKSYGVEIADEFGLSEGDIIHMIENRE